MPIMDFARSTIGRGNDYARPMRGMSAVPVAENLAGRYSTVIETLSQYVPLIAVEIRTLVLNSDPASRPLSQ